MSSNLSSKRTGLQKPTTDIEAKAAKAPEPDQASVQTAPVSDTVEKVVDVAAASDATAPADVKLNETIMTEVAAVEPVEVSVMDCAPAEAEVPPKEESKPVEVVEEKKVEVAEDKVVEEAFLEMQAKPAMEEVVEEAKPVVQEEIV